MTKALNKTIRKIKARWWLLLAVLFTALEIFLPFASDRIQIPPYLFGALSGLCSGAAFASRLMAQKEVGDGG
jgi:hypothetical protein